MSAGDRFSATGPKPRSRDVPNSRASGAEYTPHGARRVALGAGGRSKLGCGAVTDFEEISRLARRARVDIALDDTRPPQVTDNICCLRKGASKVDLHTQGSDIWKGLLRGALWPVLRNDALE